MKSVAFVVAAVVVAALTAGAAALRSYAGEQVLRVHVASADDADRLELFVEQHLLDEWASNAKAQTVDVRMPAALVPQLEALGFKYEIYVDDVQALIDAEQARLAKRTGARNEYFEEYHTYEEVVAYWDELAASFPNIVQRVTIGTSYQGRAITGIRIRGRNPTKGFFFNGLQHAREWITGPTVQGVADTLVRGYGNDTEITSFIDNIEFTIIAPLNPDGYAYTWSNDRLWRKNREPNSGTCVGTDTNRNWGYKWATGGSSSQPCSDTYHGPSAFSSKEAAAVRDYLNSRASVVDYHGYIDFHAYSQLFMSPYGADNSRPVDYNAHIAVLNDIADAIFNTGFRTSYDVGPVYSTIYQASGGSNDWTYAGAGVIYSFAAEGRDTGRYGFLLPEDQIVPSIQENVNAVKVVARAILKL